MTVPGFQEFMRPLLALGLNGEVHKGDCATRFIL
jgi:hypothetical protein